MRERTVFQIHPISLAEGFSLSCAGLLEKPLRVERVFEAVVMATQLGQGSDFEIKIFDVEGNQADAIELHRQAVLAD